MARILPDVDPAQLENTSEEPVYITLRDQLGADYVVLHSYPWLQTVAWGRASGRCILAKINEAGFTIKSMKMTKLSAEKAGQIYEVHKERPFNGELCDFMSSGHIVAPILEKSNAVADF